MRVCINHSVCSSVLTVQYSFRNRHTPQGTWRLTRTMNQKDVCYQIDHNFYLFKISLANFPLFTLTQVHLFQDKTCQNSDETAKSLMLVMACFSKQEIKPASTSTPREQNIHGFVFWPHNNLVCNAMVHNCLQSFNNLYQS